nr:hypothetical protein Q903MT_gene740 [Picea sitchensis]
MPHSPSLTCLPIPVLYPARFRLVPGPCTPLPSVRDSSLFGLATPLCCCVVCGGENRKKWHFGGLKAYHIRIRLVGGNSCSRNVF